MGLTEMRLWSDEIEAMRAASRAAVATAFASTAATFARARTGGESAAPSIDEERAQLAATFVEVPDGVDDEIAGVPCRVLLPAAPPRAIYLHFHGGGMVRGAPRMNDSTNDELRRRFALAVVSVDYRLAPEHPHPAGPDDGVEVARWLLAHGADRFGTSQLVIGGESSGAYVAAAVLLRLRAEPGAVDGVIGANLMYGMFDWGRSPSQRGVRVSDAPDMLDPRRLQFFADCYLPGRTDDERRHPAISPAFADLCGLPPALFSVGTADHLLDDTLAMAVRWAAAGNDTELFVAPDMPHGFNVLPCAITTAWEQQMTAWFRRILPKT
jgi:acetyl esterase/lipase